MSHTHFFTFGLNIGAHDCHIPELGLKWGTTKKPICFSHWDKHGTAKGLKKLSSILNWIERPPFNYNNESWGQKNIIFRQFEDIPAFFPAASFELVVNTGNKPESEEAMKLLAAKGWSILNPHHCIDDMVRYNDYIQSSAAEFSITKEAYIKSNSGWFSGRSAVYMAAGKPVVTQDTQWSKYIPEGNGLFAVNDLESGTDAVSRLLSDYDRHSKAAKEIAREYFASDKILSDMLEHALMSKSTAAPLLS